MRKYTRHGDWQGTQCGHSRECVKEWRIKRLHHEGFLGQFKDFELHPVGSALYKAVVTLEF